MNCLFWILPSHTDMEEKFYFVEDYFLKAYKFLQGLGKFMACWLLIYWIPILVIFTAIYIVILEKSKVRKKYWPTRKNFCDLWTLYDLERKESSASPILLQFGLFIAASFWALSQKWNLWQPWENRVMTCWWACDFLALGKVCTCFWKQSSNCTLNKSKT